MGWRFQRRFKVFPGVRINISKSGISTTVGGGPFHLNVGPRGIMGTASLPGTGLSYRHHFKKQDDSGKGLASNSVLSLEPCNRPSQRPVQLPVEQGFDRKEYRSGAVECMTSKELLEFKNLIAGAMAQRLEIERQLEGARSLANRSAAVLADWNAGHIAKNIRKKKFQQLQESASKAASVVEDLEAKRQASLLATELDISAEVVPAFTELCRAFSALANECTVWDETAVAHPVSAGSDCESADRVERKNVVFCLGQLDILRCPWSVPCMQNANGGDMYLFPGFVVFHVANDSFAVVSFADLDLQFRIVDFAECDGAPTNARVIRYDWARSNKDGSQDMRYKDNFRFPVCQYASLMLLSSGGLNERYLFSNADAAQSFYKHFCEIVALFKIVNEPLPP